MLSLLADCRCFMMLRWKDIILTPCSQQLSTSSMFSLLLSWSALAFLPYFWGWNFTSSQPYLRSSSLQKHCCRHALRQALWRSTLATPSIRGSTMKQHLGLTYGEGRNTPDRLKSTADVFEVFDMQNPPLHLCAGRLLNTQIQIDLKSSRQNINLQNVHNRRWMTG